MRLPPRLSDPATLAPARTVDRPRAGTALRQPTIPLAGARPDLIGAVGLLLAALPWRVANLQTAPANSDEGIRLAQLFLMSIGFRPVRDIFASQGPLSLDVTYPLFALLGGSLGAARLAVVVYSLAEIAAVYLVARQLGGRLAGLLAGLLLVLSPVYLENSRTALVEVPALLPATLAVAAALRFADVGRRRWLVASAALLALALLVKPLVLATGAAVLLALLARRADRGRNVALAAAVGAALIVVVVVLVGPSQLYDQVVRYRAGSAEAEGWSLSENVDLLLDELGRESTAWLGLVLASVPLGLLGGGRRALPAAAWLLATLGLLLVYSPLMSKHVVVLVPPAAVLVGCAVAGSLVSGLSLLVLRVRSRFTPAHPAHGTPGQPERPPGHPEYPCHPERSEGSPAGSPPRSFAALRMTRGVRGMNGGTLRLTGVFAPLPLLTLLLWYAASLPGVLARDGKIAAAGSEARPDPNADEVALLTALTGPDDYIVVDEPYLSYLARRPVPPSLADPTTFRLRSGTLTGADVIEAATTYDVSAMLLWSDGLRDLKKFGDWVDANYRQAKIWERRNGKDRALYLRHDADLEAARRRIGGELSRAPRADFAGQLRLAAAGLGQAEIRPGGALLVSSEWESLAPLAVDYRVLAMLGDGAGQPVSQIERSLGGGGVGTSAWQTGRWTVRTFFLTVPPRTPPGEYTVSLAVYDSKARTRLPLAADGGGGTGDEAPIGKVQVR